MEIFPEHCSSFLFPSILPSFVVSPRNPEGPVSGSREIPISPKGDGMVVYVRISICGLIKSSSPEAVNFRHSATTRG